MLTRRAFLGAGTTGAVLAAAGARTGSVPGTAVAVVLVAIKVAMVDSRTPFSFR